MRWKRYLPLLVIFSVALNVAFVGVWIVHAAQAHASTQQVDERGVWCALHRHLDVGEEQWERIEPRMRAFQEKRHAIADRIHRHRQSLIDAIASDDPDMERINEHKQRIHQSQKEMQRHVIEHLLEQKQLLTEAQQNKLFELMRQRSSRPGAGVWMGRGDGRGAVDDHEPGAPSDGHERGLE